jgi:predicted Zn-dependent protease
MAAQGYVELGMFEDASNELEEIEAESRTLPEVLDLRYTIYAAMGQWSLAAVSARHTATQFPKEPAGWIRWAYAARRCKSIEEAKRILLDAERQHPRDGAIQFNLGCYACQQGDHEEAKRRVSAAISLSGKFRWAALHDLDLKPLWDEIAEGRPGQ